MLDSSSTRGVVSSIFSGMYNLGCVVLFPTCFNQASLRDNAEKSLPVGSVLQNISGNFGWHVNAWKTAFLFRSLDIFRGNEICGRVVFPLGVSAKKLSFFEGTSNGIHSSPTEIPK